MESEEWSCSYLRRIPRERIYKLQEIRPAKSCCREARARHGRFSIDGGWLQEGLLAGIVSGHGNRLSSRIAEPPVSSRTLRKRNRTPPALRCLFGIADCGKPRI